MATRDLETRRLALLGRWQKTTTSPWASPYPNEMDFDERGIYFGNPGPSEGAFTIWDSGGYELVDPDHLRISTATDEERTYRFSVSEGVLQVTVPEGSVLEYRRGP